LPTVFEAFAEDKKNLNTTKGVFNGDPNMTSFITSGQRSLTGVKAIILVSDGFLLPSSHEQEKYHHIAQHVLQNGCFSTYAKIKDDYNADPEGTLYPRFKHQDDSSCVVLRF